MNLFPSNGTCCEADLTKESSVRERIVYADSLSNPAGRIRAKQIHHYRERDEARFWHWSDQEVVQI